jgi:hypothetical protein
MPGGDGTGPAGMGPMTGRAAGYCSGYPAPGFAHPGFGCGFGFGFGRGLGYGFHGFRGGRGRCLAAPYFAYGGPYAAPYAPYGYDVPYAAPYAAMPSRQQEIAALQDQAEYLAESLEGIKKRIAELEAEKAKE